MRKICGPIYSILAPRVIMSKRAETKYLSRCFSRHLYHLSINKGPLDDKLGSSNDAKSYGKPFDTKISEIDMSTNEEGDKVAKRHALLGQRLGL